jgi:hypothetical protein
MYGSKHDWGTLFKSWESTPRTPKFTFFTFPMTCFTFHPFFMSNEIISFQTLYRHLKYLLFSLMKVRIIKFIQCGACFTNGPKFPKFDFLKLFTLQLGIWFLSHSYILCTLTHKVFVVKILGQKKLFRHSL